MVFTEEQRRRHTETVNALLAFTNAHVATSIFFEPPIDSQQQVWLGMRIAQDLWEDGSLVERFCEVRPSCYPYADFELASQWQRPVKGPMALMQAEGNKALMLCEGFAFEAYSVNRPWSDMNLHLPDIVMTTLIPLDGVIVTDCFLLRHFSPMEGSGIERLWRELEEAKAAGIVRNAADFDAASRTIEEIRSTKGLDPSSYYAALDMIDYLNLMTYPSCFPYEPHFHLRNWDGEREL